MAYHHEFYPRFAKDYGEASKKGEMKKAKKKGK